MRLGYILLGAVFGSAGFAFAQEAAPPKSCDYGAPHAEAPEELSQFAFLVGDYQVRFHAWINGTWSPPQPGRTARWNGYYGLNGMAIIDEWYSPDPATDPNGPRGINVRMYDPDAEEWDMMWVDTTGRQVQDLRAKVIDGDLTMWQEYPDRPNFLATFHVEDADNWHRISYVKDEEGNWVEQFKLVASRLECGGGTGEES